MPQSLVKFYAHIVFSTKYRFPFLKDRGLRNELHSYMGGILNGLDAAPVIIGGIADHVHILCSISKSESIARTVGELKRVSSLMCYLMRSGLSHASPSLTPFFTGHILVIHHIYDLQYSGLRISYQSACVLPGLLWLIVEMVGIQCSFFVRGFTGPWVRGDVLC